MLTINYEVTFTISIILPTTLQFSTKLHKTTLQQTGRYLLVVVLSIIQRQ